MGEGEMSEELKPCPFCGGEAGLRNTLAERKASSPTSAYVMCESCLASTSSFEGSTCVSKAISAWNRRTPPAAVPDAVAAIKFALTIDDHFDRLEFLYAFLDGSVDTDEEWDDWHEYRAMISAAPAAPTKARDE